MPLALSPDEKFELVLKSDEALPESDMPAGKPPTFEFRHMSGRQQRKMAKMLDDVEAQKTSVDAIDKTFDIIKFVLVGWRNMRDANGKDIPYSPEAVEDVLQFREAQELMYRVWAYAPSRKDLGNSDSQSSSPTGESAAPAKDAGTA